MKIVVIHHYYKNGKASGENTVVEAQIRALKDFGHEVTLIRRDSSKTLTTWFAKIKVGITWALNVGYSPWRQINKIAPDIVLIHNLYPGFSTRWLRKKKFPQIYWLHNYRFFCIAATFVFHNQECLLCVKDVSYKSLIRKCADGSISKTVSSFLRLKLNRKIPEHKYLDHWVTLSPKARNLFQKTSLMSDNLSVIPNFVERNYTPTTNVTNKWVFVGRLTSEKGIIALTKNVPKTLLLDIYGDGPARSQLETFVEDKPNIQLKGDIDRNELLKLLPTYVGGFLPSFGVEGIPTTFLEFSATGLPVIGWEMNSTSDFIHKYNCGVTLNDFDSESINRAVNTIQNERVAFSKNSLYMWESEFSEQIWINNVNNLFELVKNRRNPSA